MAFPAICVKSLPARRGRVVRREMMWLVFVGLVVLAALAIAFAGQA